MSFRQGWPVRVGQARQAFSLCFVQTRMFEIKAINVVRKAPLTQIQNLRAVLR